MSTAYISFVPVIVGVQDRSKAHSKIKLFFFYYILTVLSVLCLVTFPLWTQNIFKPCLETLLKVLSCQPAPVVQWREVPLRWQWNGKLFILTHQRGKQKENLFFFLLISSKQHTKQPTATDGLPSGKVFNTSSFNSWSVLSPGAHLPASTRLLMTPAGQDYCYQEL